jgi:hypothetical protein
MDRIRGAAVAVELGSLGRHFLPGKAGSGSGESDPGRSGESGGYDAKQFTPRPDRSLLYRGRGLIGASAGHEVLQQSTAQYWKMPREQSQSGSSSPLQSACAQLEPAMVFSRSLNPKLIPNSAATASRSANTTIRIPEDGRISVSAIRTRAQPKMASA